MPQKIMTRKSTAPNRETGYRNAAFRMHAWPGVACIWHAVTHQPSSCRECKSVFIRKDRRDINNCALSCASCNSTAALLAPSIPFPPTQLLSCHYTRTCIHCMPNKEARKAPHATSRRKAMTSSLTSMGYTYTLCLKKSSNL